jgi:hypothetical protein
MKKSKFFKFNTRLSFIWHDIPISLNNVPIKTTICLVKSFQKNIRGLGIMF